MYFQANQSQIDL